ncbi:hypothetical protein V8C37DRAFT_397198 [Trichoderma ceciliae]
MDAHWAALMCLPSGQHSRWRSISTRVCSPSRWIADALLAGSLGLFVGLSRLKRNLSVLFHAWGDDGGVAQRVWASHASHSLCVRRECHEEKQKKRRLRQGVVGGDR